MANLIELRPKKDLLDSTFEGYKLSLDALPVYNHDLPVPIEHLKPNDEQYSFQHVKTFGLHNHLIEDPWNPDFIYFVAKDLQVFRTNVHSLPSQNPEFTSVWKIPIGRENRDGFFNASLTFAGPNLAVASNGGGMLHIVDTSQRDMEAQQWVVLLKFNQIDVDILVNLTSICFISDKETPFITCLEFLTYHYGKDGHWSLKQLKRIAVPHGVDYASILSPGKSLCVIAREPLGIIYDSVKSIANPRNENSTETEGVKEAIYTWAENEDEVIVWMSFDKHTSKHDLVLEIKPQFLKVVCKKETRLEGELAHSVSNNSSLWTLSDGKLEIILPKVDKTVNWNHLILTDKCGQKVLDAETAAEWHQRMIHMTTEEMQPGTVGSRPPILSNEQLEECDDMLMNEMHLFRFSGDDNQLTHKAILGGHQLLFTTPSAPGLTPAFCLRHDVDGLIWQPMGDEMETSWGCLNTAVFQALGYIQASKEQRKFTVCPPNKTYAAICDAFHHVFLYRQPNCSTNGVEMVYRPTGRKIGTVARQQVLSLETREECLGALATDTFLLVLTSSSLCAIRVNSD
nr:EOG090X08S2 [Eurycercus lamellatus]